MVNPDFGGIKPSMFTAGNREKAKSEEKTILDDFVWETEDMEMAEAARCFNRVAGIGAAINRICCSGSSIDGQPDNVLTDDKRIEIHVRRGGACHGPGQLCNGATIIRHCRVWNIDKS